MIDSILNTIRESGGSIEVLDGDLRLRVPTGLLSDQDKAVLVEHKSEVIRLLTPQKTVQEPHVSIKYPTLFEQSIGWDQAIDPPAPCQQCGSLELWQDFTGKWHCQHCQAEGLERSQRLVDQAARLSGSAKPEH